MGTRVDWMQIGKDHWTDNQKRLQKLCEGIKWQKVPCTVGGMAGMNISEAIEGFKIPKVSHIAVAHDLAPFGLYGIRGHYKSEDVEIFLIDEGTHLTPLCAFVTPTG